MRWRLAPGLDSDVPVGKRRDCLELRRSARYASTLLCTGRRFLEVGGGVELLYSLGSPLNTET